METEDILKGFADGSKEGNSAGGNNADCAEVLATICAQTAEMMGDRDETKNDAGGSTCETETVGEESEEGGLGSRESLTGVLRLNDGAIAEVKGRYALDMWRVLEAQGEFRLNDFLCDSFDCGQTWVIGGNDARGSTACHESDARRDPRWGWVPYVIPIPCGRVRIMMRDAMGNVWSTHYVNGNFSFRHLDREVSEDEKKAMAFPTHTAGCFFPPLRNLIESEVVEGKVFTDIVEHRQFLVVLARVSIFDVNVKDHVLMVEHAKHCWEKIREEERQMVCAGYDSMADQGMWSMVEGSCTGQEYDDGENRYMARTVARPFLVVSWSPFLRLVREVVEEDIAPGMGVRFQMTAVRALMKAAEAYLVANFENTNEVAIHSKRVTIQVRDMRLVDRLSKPRWVEKYQGMLDEKARAEERQQRIEARHAERDGSRVGAKKRKAVPRKGGSAKKKAA
ncbi:hypothetical protein CBR_g45774 [Chara braunii]|uniref:Core Histone H2A/H2B/H3 domain-containing protein n=1 Tax=Chara braunii TaxID=69332 RepID=A0A388LZG1_CHABU|nr:hypothetical protein CBR_g45774 [Chara braunii]|eukprot:GBG87622.1 hypothetical protein CBR_g45774 [Chara braunii]